MAFRQQLAKATGLKEKILPKGYQLVGDIVLLKLRKAKTSEKKKIADSILSMIPYAKCVVEINGISGEFREPKIQILAGSRTDTIHIENGVKYHIDVSKVMFSKGNVEERQRLLDEIKPGETVVDMFAGIGYFSLPIAKHTKAGKIVSIEKNIQAFRLLKDNIRLNNVQNVDAIWGDCRDFSDSVKNFANRVLMGYFPGTEEFLPHAIKIAKDGATVHFHNVYAKKDLWEKPLAEIKEACKAEGCKSAILQKRKVKSFSPGKHHIVVDFRLHRA